MKSVVYSWHDGISGPRLAAQFGENARHLRDTDADDMDNPEEVQRVVALATKGCKSLPKTLLSLTQIEARLSATLGFRPRQFDRTDIGLIRAERARLLALVAEPEARLA